MLLALRFLLPGDNGDFFFASFIHGQEISLFFLQTMIRNGEKCFNRAYLRTPALGIFTLKKAMTRWWYKKSQQHPKEFPGGPPPQYYPGPATVNFRVRKRSGVFVAVWPLASISVESFRESLKKCRSKVLATHVRRLQRPIFFGAFSALLNWVRLKFQLKNCRAIWTISGSSGYL